MKIVKRYVLIQFLKPFLFGLISFIIIMMVSELFESLDTFVNLDAHPVDIMLYLLYQIPEWTIQVLPVAVLLGSLFSLNKLLMTGEITAIKASGIPVQQVLFPLFWVGLAVSVSIIYLQETRLPEWNKKAQFVYRHNIRRIPEYANNRWGRIILSGKGNIKITAEELNTSLGYLKRVVVDRFKGIYVREQIDAREARWNGTAWKFIDGVERTFAQDGKKIITEHPFTEKTFDISNTPQDLAPQRNETREMNLRELQSYISHLEKIGISSIREKVSLHLKLSFPFANLIILLIGIPFALHSTRGSGKLMSFAFALMVAFAYWGVMSVGQSLGNARILPPVAAAWFANIIFGIPGIILFKRIKT